MKLINFYNIDQSGDREIFRLLTEAVTCGLDYDYVNSVVRVKGYYIPEDQYRALEALLNIQLNLDIGSRRFEHLTPEETDTLRRVEAESVDFDSWLVEDEDEEAFPEPPQPFLIHDFPQEVPETATVEDPAYSFDYTSVEYRAWSEGDIE